MNKMEFPGAPKVVVINDALDQLDNSEVWTLFGEMMRFRLQGYRSEYPPQVYPFEPVDAFASHILIGFDVNGKFEIYCAYRFSPYEITKRFGKTFVGTELARTSEAPEHDMAIAHLIYDCLARGKKITYSSTCTIHPAARGNKYINRFLKEMILATHYHYMATEELSESIASGVVRFHFDKFHKRIGYHPIVGPTEISLDSVKQKSLKGEEVIMFHLTEHSAEAKELALKHKALWDNRTVYEPIKKIIDSAA